MARSKVPHHDPAALPDDVEALYPLAKQPGPRSLLEFQQLFASEAQCAAYLRNIRWPVGFVCPKCGCPHRLHAGHAARHRVSERAPSQFDWPARACIEASSHSRFGSAPPTSFPL